jgi:hypothetical protein
MKKIALKNTLFILLVIISFLGCTSRTEESNVEKKKNAETNNNNIQKEAERKAMNLIIENGLVIKCGDTWNICKYHTDGAYSMPKTIGSKYEQFTKAVISSIASISEADRLNGIEWKGIVRFWLGGSVRSYPEWDRAWAEYKKEHRQWTKWEEAILPPSLEVNVVKMIDGQWELKLAGYIGDYKKISCSDVPK